MIQYKIMISERADNEIFEIWKYLAKNNDINYADKKVKEIKNAFFINLAQFPEMGRTRNSIKKGMRSLLVSPYIIFYTLHKETITIRGVIHESRDYKELF